MTTYILIDGYEFPLPDPRRPLSTGKPRPPLARSGG